MAKMPGACCAGHFFCYICRKRIIMEKRPENSQHIPTDPQTHQSSGAGKAVIAILALIAVVLGVMLIWFHYRNQKLIDDLSAEKEDLTSQIISLKEDFDSLSTDYESISLQLDSSREEVAQLVERIQKTEATDRAKIRQYQKELGTLRSIMRNYIVQIDSLNTLNHKLTVDAAEARKETAKVKKENDNLQQTVNELSDKVETSAVIRGRDVRVEAFNKSGHTVDRAKAVNRLLVSVTLCANNIAQTGPVRVYVVVRDPSDKLLTNSESRVCTYAGSPLETSASREVDYQGEDVDLSIYLNDIPQYTSGVYDIQVLTERTLLGKAQLHLR